MAIIKCPECGHEISDKAPVCPNCGVAIAGMITHCPQCGNVYFKTEETCPVCHHTENQPVQNMATNPVEQPAENPLQNAAPVQPAAPVQTPVTPTPSYQTESAPMQPAMEPKKKPTGLYIAIAAVVIIVAGIIFYMYSGNSAQDSEKELEAYEYAMNSNDPAVLQSYLDTYADASQAHRDSISAHLQLLQNIDKDYTNAIVSGSKAALEEYLEKHPDSPHKQEIWNKIDSIDWKTAESTNTPESYEAYLKDHADGAYIQQAQDAIKKAKSKDVQPEEKQMVSGLFRRFFQSINTRNEGGLTATCEDVLTQFLNKSQATKSDVVTFMNKLYKADVTNMNWYLDNNYDIKKREVGTDEYEYQVTFTCQQHVDREDGTSNKNKFRVNAKVSPDGKVSEFTLVKILE